MSCKPLDVTAAPFSTSVLLEEKSEVTEPTALCSHQPCFEPNAHPPCNFAVCAFEGGTITKATQHHESTKQLSNSNKVPPSSAKTPREGKTTKTINEARKERKSDAFAVRITQKTSDVPFAKFFQWFLLVIALPLLVPLLKFFNFMKCHGLVFGTIICTIPRLCTLSALHGFDTELLQ